MSKTCVPFTPVLKGAPATHARQAADQLNELIHANEEKGWDFVGLEDVTSYIPGGCLTPSAGTVTTVQVAVFENRAG